MNVIIMSLIDGIGLKSCQLYFQITLRAQQKEILVARTIRLDRQYFPAKLKKNEKVGRGF